MLEERYPEELRYSDNHLWVLLVEDGSSAIVGITFYANDQLGTITYVELPESDTEIDAHEEIGLLESHKTSYGLYSPLSGEIVAINEDLDSSPNLINSDPYGDGWLYKIKLIDPKELDELMSAEEYQEFINNL